MLSRWSRTSSGCSTWPYIMVAVDRKPCRCASRCTSSHAPGPPFLGSIRRRTRSESTSAPPPGMLVWPAWRRRLRTSGIGLPATSDMVRISDALKKCGVTDGEAPPGLAHEVEVVLERQGRVVAALEQHRGRALAGCEPDLLEHLVHREGVRLLVARPPVEGAELAVGDADVGVVGVRVDDEGHPALRNPTEAQLLGQASHVEQRGVGQEPVPVGPVEPLTGLDLRLDAAQHEPAPSCPRSRRNSAAPFSSSGPRRKLKLRR